MSDRLNDIIRFYALLDVLAARLGGVRYLRDCDGRMNWAQRGVYFFMDKSEHRTDSGDGLRIVRIGTHALKENSQTTLWKRLSQHKGVASSGAGNHRTSIFRLLVGTAILASTNRICESWDDKKIKRENRDPIEKAIEQEVSKTIGAMPFLWLDIGDPAGRDSLRGYIERNTIALLSNWQKEVIDAPSSDWLGLHCNREKVRMSGLWNQNHVDETYDPAFLNTLEDLITKARA